MRQVYIDNDRIVREVIPEFDPAFPGVPISARYSAEFLARCLEVPNEVAVAANMEYLPIQNAFAWPLRYTGATTAIMGEEPITIPVSFSQDGTWEVAETTLDDVQVSDSGIEVPANKTGTVKIEFHETLLGREMTVSIQIVEPFEPEPEEPDSPQPEEILGPVPAPATAEILDALLGVTSDG